MMRVVCCNCVWRRLICFPSHNFSGRNMQTHVQHTWAICLHNSYRSGEHAAMRCARTQCLFNRTPPAHTLAAQAVDMARVRVLCWHERVTRSRLWHASTEKYKYRIAPARLNDLCFKTLCRPRREAYNTHFFDDGLDKCGFWPFNKPNTMVSFWENTMNRDVDLRRTTVAPTKKKKQLRSVYNISPDV